MRRKHCNLSRRHFPASVHPLAQRAGRRDGFALLIALGLLSFMMLSVVAFSTLVQLEHRSAELARERVVAREHARMSLLLGLGELQRHAGPDQRATATAAVQGNRTDPSKLRVTGVWDTRAGVTGDPVWLISHPRDAVEPFQAGVPFSEAETVLLLGAGSLGPEPDGADLQRAPRVAISGSDGLAAGFFSWWVADEGVKASLGKWDRREALVQDAGLTVAEARRLLQTTPGRARVEWLLQDWDGGVAEDEWSLLREDLARTRDRRQLALVAGLDGRDLARNFHRITWGSFGVLADAGSGGLKRDLTYQGETPIRDPLADSAALRQWVNHRLPNDDALRLRGVTEAEVVPDTPVFTVPLVVAEFALYVGFFRTGAGADSLRAQIALRSDLWNPHSFPLAANPRGQPDLIFEIEGLPQHEVSWLTASGTPGEQSGSFTVNLSDVAFTGRDARPVSLDNFVVDLFSNFAVGEVRTIVERAEGPLGLAIDGDATRNTIQDDFIWTEAPSSSLTVRLKTIDGDLLQEFNALRVEGFTTEALGHNLVSRSSPSYSDYQFVYHFKFYDEVLNVAPGQLSDLELWTTAVDPRDVRMDLRGGGILEDLLFINEPGLASVDNTLFLERPEFFYGGSGSARRNYHRFFDIPSAPPVSVGALQHLQIVNRPPYSIGNPWGGAWNAVFDRYFFSTVPQQGLDWDPNQLIDEAVPALGSQPLANVHLRPLERHGAPVTLASLRSPYSSSHLLVEGAFNIHSVDPEVWMSVLGGIHLYDWAYRLNETGFNVDPVQRSHVKNGLFRHAFGADRHYTHPFHLRHPDYPEISQVEKRSFYKDYWQPDWAVAYTVGMRELRDGSNSDGINDLRELAEAITSALTERGRPFGSMRELAESGLIQTAIDNTRINTTDERSFLEAEQDIFNRFPRNAPSFLSQADVLQMIAPFSQVRSDTFLIRAYGDVFNPVTGEVTARAWCEAMVQRLPQPLEDDGTLEGIVDAPGDFGRRFVITDFRWLEEEEL